MKEIPDNIYKKMNTLTKEIRLQFLRKGIVIPSETEDGSVRIGKYIVRKKSNGFYSVLDFLNRPVVENINLPHTAILLANSLALGNLIDRSLLEKDKNYGYAAFEESVQRRTMERSIDTEKYILMLNKIDISRTKKELYKRSISNSFEKLRKFV